MAFYTGSYSDFEKFIGPRMRNIVTQKITKGYKAQIGRCQHCDETTNLESAHVHGSGRKEIFRRASNQYLIGEGVRDVDLQAFESEFARLHEPLSETILILCRPCHRKYDNVQGTLEIPIEPVEIAEGEPQVLPIQTYPADIDEFKELLLLYRSAQIITHYNNGTSEVNEWQANGFSETSNVMRNLRSRNEFRQGNWQNARISNVEVNINYP